MTLASERCIDVINHLIDLKHVLSQLDSALKADNALCAWVQDHTLGPTPVESFAQARERTSYVLNQLDYLDDQGPKEILICAGFIGASEDTLKLVNQINEIKSRFKASVLALKSEKIHIHDDHFIQEFNQNMALKSSNTRALFKQMGCARLHLKQCYRLIPILSHPPSKIAWTWANTRSIKRVTKATAENLLRRKGKDQGIEFQIQKLASLSPNEPLAIVQELAPHLRANIRFNEKECPKPRMMIKGPIPIFFPCDLSTPLPEFKPPKEKKGKDKNRLIRADTLLEAEPFLPAIRAHRYALKVPLESL